MLNGYTPCIPQFYYIKCGLRGYLLHGHVFLMDGSYSMPMLHAMLYTKTFHRIRAADIIALTWREKLLMHGPLRKHAHTIYRYVFIFEK